MLEGDVFPEGRELKGNGLVQIELLSPEDDPTALMIILGLLHGNDVELPTDLDLPGLEKVAVLVDKYQ